MTDGLNAVWSNDRAAHTDTNPKNLELAPPQSITATRLDQYISGQWKLSVYTRERTQSRPTCGAVMGWKRLISGLDSFLYTCGIIYYTE